MLRTDTTRPRRQRFIMSYDIRTMTRRDLALVLEWAEAEG
jgi:hypothetical protein